MDELRSEAEALRHLAREKPTPERLGQVRSALSSKWEGSQSLALKILGEWGGRESVATIRQFLGDAFAREYGWSIRGVAVRTLAALVDASDADWVLDLYFSRPGRIDKHELLPLVLKLPPEPARARLVRALSDPDPLNRQAAVKAIGNMAFADRSRLLRPLRDDPDREVRASAKALGG